MPDIRDRDRDRNDVILMPRQYAIVKDTTKGNLIVNVGPMKVTVSETDRLMVPDPRNPSLLVGSGNQDAAILPYVDVGESDYVVLNNPPKDVASILKPRTQNDMVELSFGRKVNLPGPISFPLWPFQYVDVIKGHQLQTNQYLVVKVINDVEALVNWSKSIVKTAEAEQASKGIPRPTSLSIGQLIIIKGTEVSFYIPPTGLEVVKDDNGQYVRDAVTLEQLEYCVLVDQNGQKRFEQGPKVVFPTASEEFVMDEKSIKFKATELTEISGLHIKVTAPYTETGVDYKVGDELFLTGKETPIYFPRAEHAIVRYGDKTKHHATAIPKGEGRYVMNRITGDIHLVRGPKMLLPDPRKEVLVRRILSDKQTELWYPGNSEAIQVNRTLVTEALRRGTASGNFLEKSASTSLSFADSTMVDTSVLMSYSPAANRSNSPTTLVGESVKRSDTYTPPRQIVLDTKYEGAVQVDVWTGYAVLIVDKSGNREVVVGPQTVLLEFDQSLSSMELSSGKPKTTDKLIKTSYLRVLNNQVSDVISATTADDISVQIKISYRVNFLIAMKDKWFDAENYVKLLCDHTRSKIRNVVKKKGIQDFQDNYIDLIRDTILGLPSGEGESRKPRPGLTFAENGAHIYDVELLGLDIGDRNIAEQLQQAQRQTIADSLKLVSSKRQLELSKEHEHITQQLLEVQATTKIQSAQLQKQVMDAQASLEMVRLQQSAAQQKATQALEAERQVSIDIAHRGDLERSKLLAEQDLAKKKAELEIKLKELEQETKNLTERAEAVSPDLIAALQRFSDADLTAKMAEAMAPMGLLGGKSVAEVLGKLLQGTGLEKLATGVALGGLPSALSKGR
jgi:major vault protein